ncbi:MAG: L-seryl-tRNA(Sec) selenium transferase [Acidobacteriota bacterium]
MSATTEILRRIPSVDQLLHRPSVQALVSRYTRRMVLREIQQYLGQLREEVSKHVIDAGGLELRLAAIEQALDQRLALQLAPSLRKVVNATGVILHTNIGRAPLPEQALEAVRELACSYSNLEYDLEAGERGHRDRHFEPKVRRLLGCEAATVVNNNAAAVFLILNTLAAGRRVLVSRGELIEIGGSFRIPAIMAQSGAILAEVGTTNKTRLADYEEAIDADTALILRVHPSNYRIIGFTQRTELRELADLAKQRGIPLVKDAGSGYLLKISHPALRNEPSVEEALAAGADLVCFSGDKVMGGPQAGLIVGKKDLIAKIRRNPLMRVCRVDKLTYGILEWTLSEYEKGTCLENIPVYRMLLQTQEEVQKRAKRLAARLRPAGFKAEVAAGVSLLGGGSAPEETIPTALLLVSLPGVSASRLESRLRRHTPPILARTENDRVAIDLRTVKPGEEDEIFAALSLALSPEPEKSRSGGDQD